MVFLGEKMETLGWESEEPLDLEMGFPIQFLANRTLIRTFFLKWLMLYRPRERSMFSAALGTTTVNFTYLEGINEDNFTCSCYKPSFPKTLRICGMEIETRSDKNKINMCGGGNELGLNHGPSK